MTDNVSNVEALPQAETKSTEINKETTPEQDTKIFIPVKYNKQVMNLDIESASELAQKGMKFDSISKDYEKIKQILFIINYSNNILIIHFLANAHGSSAAALSPSRPSASQSTVSPLAKAMKRHTVVFMPVGMQRIMAGSNVSMM